MKRQTLLALSLAATLALPVGFSTSALAVTPEQQAELAAAASIGGPTMQATIARVLEANAQDRPLAQVLDEMSAALMSIGAVDEIKAELAVALVAATRQLAASGALPGATPDAAAEAAAEAVLVDAQDSPTLVSAIVAQATSQAASDGLGGQGAAVLGAFSVASTSPMIAQENRAAVQNALVSGGGGTDVAGDTGDGGAGNGGAGDGGGTGTGGGPDLGNMNMVNVIAGSTSSGTGVVSQDTTGRGETISPN